MHHVLPPSSHLILGPTFSFNLLQHSPAPVPPPPFLPPHTIGSTSQTTPQPSKDSRPFRRFWVRMGEESSTDLWKFEWWVGGRCGGRGIGLWFPLNCPTWLSVLSLNKHSHFLLTAHIEHTDKRACTYIHTHNAHQQGAQACLNSSIHSMGTHEHNTLYTLASNRQYSYSKTPARKDRKKNFFYIKTSTFVNVLKTAPVHIYTLWPILLTKYYLLGYFGNQLFKRFFHFISIHISLI